MLTQTQKTCQQFNPYYRDNSILIVLILIDFLETFKLTGSLSEANVALDKVLKNLLGENIGNPSQLIVNWTHGPLTKIKDRSALFVENAQFQSLNCLLLYETVKQAWLKAFHFLDGWSPTQPAHYNVRFIKGFSALINRLARQMPALIKPFQNHDHVVAFLWSKQEELENIFGPRFFTHTLKLKTKVKESDRALLRQLLERANNR